ncbi:hypothetical protein WR25_18371 [Diploscapter pachys]|uniref:Uncharacterized protein n=1 Tax=Diploscapter pachys TaxID=2018661 RepID=A0A2A2JZE5_9BILA|nr:hypothetical protein WR25_18371 [Diploscapter pachys]
MHSPLPVVLPPLQPVLSLSLCISSIPTTPLCLFLLSTALLFPLPPVHSAMISPTHCNATSICPACCAVLHSLESCLEDEYHEKFMIKVNGDGVLGAMVSLSETSFGSGWPRRFPPAEIFVRHADFEHPMHLHKGCPPADNHNNYSNSCYFAGNNFHFNRRDDNRGGTFTRGREGNQT